MGHGLYYGQLPVAGSFYKANKKILKGKVYMVQNPKLPFAALHGDPDVVLGDNTRFGPTALVMPKLERFRGNSTISDFFSTLRLDMNIVKIFKDLLKDSEIRNYILRNFIFEVPYFGKKAFLKDARKIVPSLREKDIEYAHGFGGVRAQILDKKNQKLMLGEASINTGDGIVTIGAIELKDSIIITIQDNGGGIDQAIIDRVFEPYFTTKFKDDGTGIGLYMSKMIIEESMHGKLTLVNKNNGVLATIVLDK
jgi:L-2-hydroxyglutarate oxidase LhgO